MKKKITIALVMVFAVLTYITCVSQVLDANAEGMSVTMGGKTLETGFYWYVGTQLQDVSQTAPDATVTSDYIYYDASTGTMTVYGNFSTADMSGVQIDGGTLILSGTGNLKIVSNVDGIAAITGTNGAGIRTEGFSGNITILGVNNANAIIGLTTVELETTSGEIIFYASKQSDAFIDAENVSLKGTEISFASNGEPNTFIKATRDIKLISNNDMSFSGSYSGPLFVGSSVNLESTSGGIDFYNNSSNYIVNGNLTMKAAGDITVNAGTSVTTGNLNITGADNIYISSEAVTVEDSIIINNSTSVRIFSNTSSVCKGDAYIWIKSDRSNDHMILSGSGDSPVVGGTLTVNPYIRTNTVERVNNGSSAYTSPFVGTYPSAGMVSLEEYSNSTGAKLASYACVDGVIYNTNQGTCEHPLVDIEGECRVCRSSNIDIAELTRADGTKAKYSSLYDAVAGAANGETVTLLHNCDAANLMLGTTGTTSYTGPLSNKSITLNLGGYKLQRLMIATERALTIENGAFYGSINHGANDGKLTLKNLKGEIEDLQWMPVDGVWLENSQLSAVGNLGCIFVEKISMDESSVLDIKNIIISNYGKITDVEEALGGIKEFLPYGYQLAQKQPYTDIINTVVDENGEIARNILLKYKRLTDPEAVITVDTSSVVYDGTSKVPAVAVSYDGTVLAANRNYRVTYNNNVNAGTATIHIEGIGVYHDSVDKTFVIDKANQAAPTGLVPTAETIDGKNDGKIANLSSKMEYSVDNRTWIDANTDALTNLPDGDYYVRFKETANYYASPSTKVTVAKGTVSATTQPDTSGTATTQQTKVDTPKDTTTQEPTGVTDKTVSTGDAYPLAIMLTLMIGTGVWIVGMIRRRKNHDCP